MFTHLLPKQKTNKKICSDPEREVKKLPALTQSDWILPILPTDSSMGSCYPDIHAHNSSRGMLMWTRKTIFLLFTPPTSTSHNVCLPNTHSKPANREHCVTWSTCSRSCALFLSIKCCVTVSHLTQKSSPIMLSR